MTPVLSHFVAWIGGFVCGASGVLLAAGILLRTLDRAEDEAMADDDMPWRRDDFTGDQL